MVTLEEIVAAMDNNKENDYSEEESKWKPTVINDYIAPKLNIEDVDKTDIRAVHMQEKQLGKILAFVKRIQKIRSASGCTIMPIPVYLKRNIDIWGSRRNVGNGIQDMIKIKLIEVYDDKVHFGSKNKKNNKAKLYKYYREVETEFLQYCQENGIEEYKIKNLKNNRVKTLNNIDINSVRFSSNLRLVKPNSCSEADFENYLLDCLYNNYPALKFYQHMADVINEKYYKDYPEFRIRFQPNFTWSKGGKWIRKIGLRASNELCNLETKEREEKLKQYGFNGKKDVKSSVPRLTLALNSGVWIDEETDIYKAIFDHFSEGEVFTEEKREAVKTLFMRVYFEHSDKKLTQNIMNKMSPSSRLKKDEVHDVLKRLKDAAELVCGEFYGSDIFFVESCIYLDVLYTLLKSVGKVWLLYDCFYYEKEDFHGLKLNELLKDTVSVSFYKYYNVYVKKIAKGLDIKDIE